MGDTQIPVRWVRWCDDSAQGAGQAPRCRLWEELTELAQIINANGAFDGGEFSIGHDYAADFARIEREHPPCGRCADCARELP
jgi:hypothetical protein